MTSLVWEAISIFIVNMALILLVVFVLGMTNSVMIN